MIEIDIHTKRISSDTKIYVVRPGPNYRLFDQFVDNNFVGPDLPDLALPAFIDIGDVGDLADRVARSMAIRKYVLAGRQGDEPPLDLQNYASAPSNRALSQFLRLARAYFGAMKQGDLVIVPPANFRGLAHIGELIEPPNSHAELAVATYPGMPLTGRNVRWLATIEKAKLPAQTLDALQKPSALFLLAQSAFRGIFRRAYGSYVTADEYGTRFEVSAETYQTIDDFHIQAFFNFVTANTARVSAGQTQLLGLREGAFSGEGIAPDLYTNVNSPGGLSLKSAVVTPIVIAVMLTLAVTLGADAYAAATGGMLTIGNSLAPAGDACVTQVNEQVITQLQLLGYDAWAEACEVARKAADRTGISTTVDVKN
jgi:hypothetical protein